MLHHVALEVEAARIPAERVFWTAVGFVQVPVPEALGEGYTWFERGGTQIHLMHSADPVVPGRGHVAIVVPDFEATMERLRDGGFQLRPGREIWGEPRVKVSTPAGHVVELMAAPPPSQG
jgi:catechol 2,3-dioxygenase-like lactoylglutathione lyase family enzyme